MLLYRFPLIFIFLFSFGVYGNGPQSFFKFDDRRPAWLQKDKTRPWQSPNYKNQKEAIGYDSQSFSLHPEMRGWVSFWVRIYSEYSTSEGLLHDSIYPEIIYEVIKFQDIVKSKKLTMAEKYEAKEERIGKRKKVIGKHLKRLSKLKSSKGLRGKDLKYWKLFKNIKEKNKFIKATHKTRLRFQLGQSDRILKGFYYSGGYIERMEGIFKKYGVPLELTRLAFVESSFNLKAHSQAGALGIWQFLKPTAKAWLKINASVDERLDPLESTRAAALFLKQNYKILGTWPLAVTAYNRGAYGVKRMLRTYKEKTLVPLLKKRKGYFRFASANFYANFLAILEVERKGYRLFGSRLKWSFPVEGEKIILKKTIKKDRLLRWFNGDREFAQILNPHIRKQVWKGFVRIGKGNFIRVPKASYAMALQELKTYKSVSLYKGKLYKVRRGDTFIRIARRFGVSLVSLQKKNPNIKPKALKKGQTILIPSKKRN